jgi:hypothetical protein
MSDFFIPNMTLWFVTAFLTYCNAVSKSVGSLSIAEESLTSIRAVYRKDTGNKMYKSLESRKKKTG